MRLGSTLATKAYLGTTAITKAYLGSTLVADFTGGTPTPELVERTAFGTAAPSGSTLTPVATYNDLGTNGWTGGVFYTSGTAPSGAVELVGGRYWVPTGSAMIGQTAVMGYWNPSTIAGKVTRANATPTAALQGVATSPQVSKTLVQGWNDFRLAAPVSIPWGDGVAVGFKVGTGIYYIAGPIGTQDKPAYRAGSDGPWLSEDTATIPRGFFGNVSNGTASNPSWAYQGGWYGADIIIRY
jgi:hypothetical protein